MRNRILLMMLMMVPVLMMAGCAGFSEAMLAERGTSEDSQVVGTWRLFSDVTQVMRESVFKDESADSLVLTFHEDGSLESAESCHGQRVATALGNWTAVDEWVRATWSGCDASFSGRIYGRTLILVANPRSADRIEMHLERRR